MRKYCFIITMLLSAIVSIPLFTSCGSDDDPLIENKSLENTIWTVYARENYLNDQQVDGYSFKSKTWTLYADGTCKGFETGTWHIGGNSILVTTNYSGYDEVKEYKIIESKPDKEKGTWEVVLRKEYDDEEFDYQLYYMRLSGVIDGK
ncbi:MAG: hypothetical protein ACI4EX_12870 [Lachnospiraceae bacterium]